MDKIILARRKGKTTELIKRSAATNEYIVCQTMAEAQIICRNARSMNLSIPQPISYSEFIDGRYHGRGIKGFLVDNIEKLLDFISDSVPVSAFTMNP